jgi:hypothetical protein
MRTAGFKLRFLALRRKVSMSYANDNMKRSWYLISNIVFAILACLIAGENAARPAVNEHD